MGDLAKVNGIDIWWEDFGDSKNPTVLFIMGAYTNSQAWPMGYQSSCSEQFSRYQV